MKTKKIFMIMAVMMAVSVLTIPMFSAHADDGSSGGEEMTSTKIMFAFTEEDIKNDFQNYTENTYSYSEDQNIQRSRGLETEYGSVIGAVYDNSTGEYLSNIQVYFRELDYCVTTGENGRFEITEIPDGRYTVIVSGDGYFDAVYENMPISHYTGTDIYSLAISKTYPVSNEVTLPEECIETENIDSEIDTCYDVDECDVQTASYTIPTLPTFSVNYNGTITTYGANNYFYLYYVVASELYAPDSSLYAGLTEAQILEGFKAQAIAARTYATTRAAWGLKHLSSGYNFCSTVCCQVYDPTKTNTMSIRAVNDTNNRIVYDVTKNRVCDTHFFASCLGNTKSYFEWQGSNVSYLVSVTCPYDLRPTEKLGHGVGMCQDGAMGYAGQGWTCDEILEHYYTGTEVITANPNPVFDPDSTND